MAKPAPEIQLQHEFGTVYANPGYSAGYGIEVSQPGTYELKTSSGRTLKVEVPALPDPIEIEGPWELEFAAGLGAPRRMTLDRLISWTSHSDPGVKYFSGVASYFRKFELPARVLAKDRRRLDLDLGRVSVIAQVKLNGRDLGILWKPPFRADVTNILRAGANDLVVSVVNLWPNRLIGDEQLSSDREWKPQHWGEVLARYPKWLLENKPSPTGRVTFTTWKHWSKDDPLMESGLLGPVRIISRARVST